MGRAWRELITIEEEKAKGEEEEKEREQNFKSGERADKK